MQDPSLLQLNITISDYTLLGEHFLQLSGTLNPFLYAVHEFKLIVDVPPNSGAPYFLQPLTSPLTVYLLVKSKYKLPAIKDPDRDNPSVSIVYYVKGLA